MSSPEFRRITGFTARAEGKDVSDTLGRKPGGDEVRNVSEQSQSREDLEKALVESKKFEGQLREIIDTIPTLAWCNLPDGTNEFQNQRWYDYTGLSPEEVRGWGWKSAIHPEDLPRWMDKWETLREADQPGECEVRLRRFDGAFRSFLFRVEPLRYEAREAVRWYGTATDIEDRKRTEDLAAGEKRLLEMVTSDHSMQGILEALCQFVESMTSGCYCSVVLIDPSGTRLENGAAPSLPASFVTSIIGRPVNADSGPCAMAAYLNEQVIAADIATETRWAEYEWCPMALAHGVRACWSTPISSTAGKVLGAFAIYYAEPRTPTPQDRALIDQFTHIASITVERERSQEALRRALDEIRRSEAKLRQAIDTIPTLAWSAGPDGSADFLNQRWLDYTGMSVKQAQGGGWAEAIHPDDRRRLIEDWKSSFASGTALEAEARMRRFDGSFRWFLFRANALRDESGSVVRWYGTNIDIEDRKRGEASLRARELSWRQIIDNIPGFAYALSATGEPEFINRQTLEYFGKTSEELKDWARLDIVHPDDLPRAIEALTKAIEAGRDYEIEQRCKRADGVYRWFQVRGRPVRNAEDKITAWYFLLTDIDARKKAEEALRTNERKLSLMINAIPTLIQVSRPDGTVLSVNQAVLDYYGLSLEDMQKEDFRNRFYHPDDVERLRDVRREALKRPIQFEYEQRALGKDGRYRWFLVRYKPLLDDQGRIDQWYVAAFDIEDRKQAEALVEQAYLRLAEAQRLSKTGSFITDLLVDEHNWSEETFRIFEFDPAARVTVQMIRDTVHPEDLPSFDAVIARGMTGTDVDFAFRIVTSRGAVKHLRGMARVMAQSGGRPMFIGALQDLTESKAAEEALNTARSQLARVARVATLNALTASIAHEVNQPLSGIVTNASTCLRMLDGDPPNVDGARETARRAIRDGNRASDVIKRLRALFSRDEFTPEPLDLNDATREVIALSLSDLQRNRVVLRSELADDLPLVTGDRVQLQQVILNLLRNASDAMSHVEDRPRELLVTTDRDAGGRARLTVKDVGVGFTVETVDKLFEAFYTTKSDGMGIGLSISRSIIEAHRGRLWATANDGPGATFSFSIPCGHAGVPAAHTAGAD